jgi:hypothetical protein
MGLGSCGGKILQAFMHDILFLLFRDMDLAVS